MQVMLAREEERDLNGVFAWRVKRYVGRYLFKRYPIWRRIPAATSTATLNPFDNIH